MESDDNLKDLEFEDIDGKIEKSNEDEIFDNKNDETLEESNPTNDENLKDIDVPNEVNKEFLDEFEGVILEKDGEQGDFEGFEEEILDNENVNSEELNKWMRGEIPTIQGLEGFTDIDNLSNGVENNNVDENEKSLIEGADKVEQEKVENIEEFSEEQETEEVNIDNLEGDELDAELQKLIDTDKNQGPKIDVSELKLPSFEDAEKVNVSEKVILKETQDTVDFEELTKSLENEKRKKHEKKIKNILIGISIFIFIVLLFITFIFSGIAIEKINERHNQIQNKVLYDVKNRIKQPKNVSNNQQYIQLNIKEYWGDNGLTLSKMITNDLETVFFFKEYIDTSKYYLTLTDDKGNSYGIDLDFDFNSSVNSDDYKTVVRFEPLKINTKSIKLQLKHKEIGEYFNFDINFYEPIRKVKCKVLNYPITFDNGETQVTIESAEFLNSRSTLYYTLASKLPTTGFVFKQLFYEDEPSVSLIENGKELEQIRKTPLEYKNTDGDYFQMIRVDFEPLENLGNTVEFKISNIYKSFTINQRFNSKEVSSRNTSGKKVLNFIDGYNLVVEGLEFFNDKYVLVFHGEKISDLDSSIIENIKMEADIELIITNPSGEEIFLTGKSKVTNKGGDMIFEISPEMKSKLGSYKAKNIDIYVKSVLLDAEDTSTKLIIPELLNRKVVKMENMEKQIINSFKERLEYNNNERSLEKVSGFSNDSLISNKLNYIYLENTESIDNYKNIQIVYMTNYNEDIIYAIVKEEFLLTLRDGQSVIKNYTHKVKLEKNIFENSETDKKEEKYLITEDILLEE